MAYQGVELFIPIYDVWILILAYLLVFIFIGAVYLIFRKIIPKEFYKFPLWKIIILAIIILITLITSVFPETRFSKEPLMLLFVPFGLVIVFISYQVLLSAIETFVKLIRDKKRKKKSKDAWSSAGLLVFLNPLTIAVILFIMISLASNIVVSFKTPCGVQIKDITPSSPAQIAGLTAGERVMTFDGKTIITITDFVTIINKTISGQTINLRTDKKDYTITLTNKENSTSGFLGIYPGQAYCNR